MNDTTAPLQILVLPSWYPSAIHETVGDFAQRHVQAIAGFASQYVIHIVKDEQGKVTDRVAVVKNEFGNYTEEIIYYHPKKTGISPFDRFMSDRMYQKLYKKAILNYIASKGLPSLTHVHVVIKAGLLAVWLKKKFAINFIVTEHWSGYLDAAGEKFTDLHPLVQKRASKVFDAASMITAVSFVLKKALGKITANKSFTVIPNVVDDTVFFSETHQPAELVRFIHASSMDWAKNTEGILKAVQLLKTMDPKFMLRLYGPVSAELKTLVRTYGITDHVLFEGEVSQHTLGAAMRASDAFIMNSRYETFGNVVIEANACGLPVIASDIPIFRELITGQVNGVFVKENDPSALAQSMLEFMQGKISFDKKLVTQSAEKYRYDVVGGKFAALYNQLIIDNG